MLLLPVLTSGIFLTMKGFIVFTFLHAADKGSDYEA